MNQRSTNPGPSIVAHLRAHGIVYSAVAIVLAAAFAFVAWRANNGSQEKTNTVMDVAPAAALTVTSATARSTTWPLTLHASGPIAAWEEASIGTQIGGYQLIEVRVNVGDAVKKGEVLARMDRALLQADEEQLKANAEQAAANRERALILRRSGAMSEQDVLQFVTQSRTADAQLSAKRLQLRYADVVAPDDGVISARSATLGAVVPVGQELFRMIRQNRLEWRGELTPAQLAQVGIGQPIVLTLPNGAEATARVRQLAPALRQESRLGVVYADIAPGSRARAGMYADGQIVLKESPALVIPAESVVIRDGRSYVMKLATVSAHPVVRLQAVSVGRRAANEVEILDGVMPDERVVVRGAGLLNDGDIVVLADIRAVALAPTGEGAQ